MNTFLEQYNAKFAETYDDSSRRSVFIRHLKTPLNAVTDDGIIFLGQSVDANVLPPDDDQQQKIFGLMSLYKIDKVYSSPATRCLETLEPTKVPLGSIVQVDALKEINYGLMDGRTLGYLKRNYSDIWDAWMRKEDPKFPDGENTQNVVDRLNPLIETQGEENSLNCTHNVVMRTLIGSHLELPMYEWVNITIPHIEPVELIYTSKGPYLNLEKPDLFLGKIDFTSL